MPFLAFFTEHFKEMKKKESALECALVSVHCLFSLCLVLLVRCNYRPPNFLNISNWSNIKDSKQACMAHKSSYC